MIARPHPVLGWTLGAVAAVVAVAASPLFTVNDTSSLPRGIYMRTFQTPAVGSIVLTPMPEAMFSYLEPWPKWVAYFRKHDLLKPVAAGPGDRVCERDGAVRINGGPVAARAITSFSGQAAPVAWEGCALLVDAVFLLSHIPDSLDSRYYGPVELSDVLTYRLVWEFEG